MTPPMRYLLPLLLSLLLAACSTTPTGEDRTNPDPQPPIDNTPPHDPEAPPHHTPEALPPLEMRGHMPEYDGTPRQVHAFTFTVDGTTREWNLTGSILEDGSFDFALPDFRSSLMKPRLIVVRS